MPAKQTLMEAFNLTESQAEANGLAIQMPFTADAGSVMSEGEFRQLLDKLSVKLTGINTASAKLFDRSNRALGFLPPGVSDVLYDALIELRDLMARFFEELAKIVLNPGWPPGLFSAANDWTSKIGCPISALSGKLSPISYGLTNFWKGPAAAAYAATAVAAEGHRRDQAGHRCDGHQRGGSAIFRGRADEERRGG